MLENLLKQINSVFWNYFLIMLLSFCGIYFTFALKFIQIRKFGEGFSIFLKKRDKTKGVSPFQALMTSISAQVGTGNIAGVSLALVLGGPGSIFWMWISGFFGMATIFAEATLAQKFKQQKNGETYGGPAYYIEKAIGKKSAKFFSFFAILGLGLTGCLVQSNSVSNSFETAFGINPLSVGIILAVMSSFIFFGGTTRLSKVTEKIVPFMAFLYILGALIVIFANIDRIIPTFSLILSSAFAPLSLAGGFAGISVKSAVRYGICRGLFSNEAGMGSTPHAHALATVPHPCKQGVVAIMGVFIDTFVILTITAFVILTAFGSYEELLSTGMLGVSLAQYAFSSVLGQVGIYFIAVCMFFFGFSSILGLYLFGEINTKYLFGEKYIKLYTLMILFSVVLGSILNVEFAWEIADLMNGLIVVPNVISLLALSKVLKNLVKTYDK